MKYVLILLGVVLLAIVIWVINKQGNLNPGNKEEFAVSRMKKLDNSPLKGKNLIFLGSSVTVGFAGKSESFVHMIEHCDGANVTLEAVSGTTLVDKPGIMPGGKSYIERLRTIDKNIKADAFICQLSTNDATKKYPLGEIAPTGTALEGYDLDTVIGSIEYVIDYAKQTWNCPVLFYTGTQYNDKNYEAMVQALKEVAKKWKIDIINLWDNKELNEKYRSKTYMNDGIHPTRKGYQQWTPYIREGIIKAINK